MLEFAVPVKPLALKCDIDLLESVLRRSTNTITEKLKIQGSQRRDMV